MNVLEKVEENNNRLAEFFNGPLGDTPLKIACAELMVESLKVSFFSQMTEMGKTAEAIDIIHTARKLVIGSVKNFVLLKPKEKKE